MSTMRLTVKATKRVVPLAVGLGFFPITFLSAIGVGLLDLGRNRQRTLGLVDRYFAGNGVFTWLLAPFNLLMDVLCLPFVNKKIYKLEDLPKGYREEIESIAESARTHDLVGQLKERVGDRDRAMIFFKWYGRNVETSVDLPDYHREFRYVRTIGCSVFNTRQSTGKHFGPMRVTLRVLINVNDVKDPNAYIQVGNHVHRWADEKVFIFDDTLLHQSMNETDEPRYCMFVDILRPSYCNWLLSTILAGVRVITSRFNACFYKHWTFVK